MSIISNNINYGDYSGITSPFRFIQPSSNSIITVNDTYVNENENIVSPVTFTFSARGDLGSSSEYFQVFDENGQLLTQINGNNYDCDESFDYVTYLSNTNQLSQWLADGVINFTFQASYAVDGFCEYTDVGVMFSYNGIDYNQNISIYDYDISWYPSNFNFYINDASSLVTSLNGNLSISEDQSIGNYDLEVYNYDTESWVLGQSLFSITEPTSLDEFHLKMLFRSIIRCNY